MIKINLLPKEVTEKGKGVEWIFLGAGLFGLFIVFAGVQYLFKWQLYQKYRKTEISWKRQLDEQQSKVQQVTELDGKKVSLELKKSTVTQLFRGRLLYPQFMENFFKTLPKDVWVSDLTLSEDAQTNIGVVATSSSLTVDGIAEWLQTLESNPERFTAVTLSAIDSKQEVFGFTITFLYHPPPLTGT